MRSEFYAGAVDFSFEIGSFFVQEEIFPCSRENADLFFKRKIQKRKSLLSQIDSKFLRFL
jgi:hypothetical protein